MNVSLTEGSLKFLFSDVRVARRWDGSAAYTNGVRKLSATSAADFCAVLANDGPVLVEVTDYRGHRLGSGGSRSAIRSGALVDETVAKIRDSVVGILWACARSLDATGDEPVESVAQHLVNRHDGPPKLLVVFWLEDDSLDAQSASVIAQKISTGLRHWLRPKIIVTNKRLESMTSTPLAWLTVT